MRLVGAGLGSTAEVSWGETTDLNADCTSTLNTDWFTSADRSAYITKTGQDRLLVVPYLSRFCPRGLQTYQNAKFVPRRGRVDAFTLQRPVVWIPMVPKKSC